MDEVATSDPNYLIWARREEDLSDEEFHAIEEARERHDVPADFPRYRPHRAMHITKQKKK